MLLTYLLAIVLALVVVYYIQSLYNEPQPHVSMAYNSVSHIGYGYINNTLSYAISISEIYCRTPSNERYDFATRNNDTLQPGSNTFIEVASNSTNLLPANCTNWGVHYSAKSANTTAGNAPYFVQTGPNTIVVK